MVISLLGAVGVGVLGSEIGFVLGTSGVAAGTGDEFGADGLAGDVVGAGDVVVAGVFFIDVFNEVLEISLIT